MCSAVESIHDIVSGKYSSKEKEQSEDTLLQMLRRVLECIKTKKTTCITEVETRNELDLMLCCFVPKGAAKVGRIK